MKRNESPKLLDYKETMGQELGEAFFRIENEVIFLHEKWFNYLELFGVDKERIQLLNLSAPSFFRMIQQGLFENVIMSIARLSDPKESSGYKNLSLRVLPELVNDEELERELYLQVESKWGLKLAVEFAREWRRKKYAHADYDISLGKSCLQESASKANIELVLEVIRNVLNTIKLHYFNSKTFYNDKALGSGSKALLRCLGNSQKQQQNIDKL